MMSWCVLVLIIWVLGAVVAICIASGNCNGCSELSDKHRTVASKMKPLYIFDLDGTLALTEHRRHFVERPHGEKDWKAFFEACADDTPNDPVIETLERLRESGADIWIFSGRSDEVRPLTVKWLIDKTTFLFWELNSRNLLMRKAGDRTPDHVLKKRWFDEMSNHDRARLVAVFEDRDRVVKMWRSVGVPCFQVADGDF